MSGDDLVPALSSGANRRKGDVMNPSDAALRERLDELELLGASWETTTDALGIAREIEAKKKEIIALLDAARAEQREMILKALCPQCSDAHVLENGRVWGFCGAWKAINANPLDEALWVDTIRSQR